MRSFVLKWFFIPTDRAHIQFLRYVFVGLVSTLADMGFLFVFVSRFGLYYLISVAIAFFFGLLISYLLSVAWVFQSTGDIQREFARFAAVGLSGLSLTELIMWLLVSRLRVYYMLAKLTAVVLVIVWNFVMRRKFVFNY